MEGFRILTFLPALSSDPTSYRGLYRCPPSGLQNLFDMDALWKAEAHAEDDHGLHHDLTVARHFMQEYRALGIPCELIWLKVGRCEESEGIGQFLGYDVAWEGWYSYSALDDVLFPPHPETIRPPHDDTEKAGYVLLELTHRYFHPLLNEHGLFSDYETAEFFRQVEHAFQTLVPSLVEQDGYEVIGVFEVDPWERNEANQTIEAAFLARLEENNEKMRMSGGTEV